MPGDGSPPTTTPQVCAACANDACSCARTPTPPMRIAMAARKARVPCFRTCRTPFLISPAGIMGHAFDYDQAPYRLRTGAGGPCGGQEIVALAYDRVAARSA